MISLVQLGRVADVVSGVGFPKEMQGCSDGEVPVFKVGDISNALKSGTRHLRKSPNHLSTDAAKILSKTLLPPGTTVFAKIGEGLKLNRRGILAQPSLVDNNVMGLIPRAGVVAPDFLYYFMQTVDLGLLSQATAIPSVRKSDVVEILIPLRSLSEQESVVAEIEKQFSRLDEAVAGLQRIKANLKRYKAAVLKSAVEGRLVETEADLARREGRDYETGDRLLQRILDTRRRQWQGKGKYKEPAAPDAAGTSELPEGWAWATIEQLGCVQLGKMLDKRKHITGEPYRYVRNINVRWGGFDLSDLLEMNFEPDELTRFEIRDGDVLVCEGGEPARAAVWRKGPTNLKYQKALHRVRFPGGYVPELLVVVLEHMAKSGRLDHLYGGSTIKHFTREVFVTLQVPLPPLPEQHRIVAEVDRLLSIAREAEAQVDANLQRAQALRQAILSKAFSPEPAH